MGSAGRVVWWKITPSPPEGFADSRQPVPEAHCRAAAADQPGSASAVVGRAQPCLRMGRAPGRDRGRAGSFSAVVHKVEAALWLWERQFLFLGNTYWRTLGVKDLLSKGSVKNKKRMLKKMVQNVNNQEYMGIICTFLAMFL